ncbi:hypothetical protein [Streptomyces sp. NRRL S-920]|nr:hypothetical protein [Streptomyces sp. NRRL S-920]
MWEFVLLLFAVICLGLAALNVPASRVSLGWLGLFFFVLVPFIHELEKLR